MTNEHFWTDEELVKLKNYAGIPYMPTQLTATMRKAVAGEGPRAYDWSDKPHRLVYDLCRHIEYMEREMANERDEITISDTFRATLEDIIAQSERPLINELETGFRHSPLTQKEREQRYVEALMGISSQALWLLANLERLRAVIRNNGE